MPRWWNWYIPITPHDSLSFDLRVSSKRGVNKMPRWWNWYTRTTQNRVSQGMGVRLSPSAPKIKNCNIREYEYCSFLFLVHIFVLYNRFKFLVKTMTSQQKPPDPHAVIFDYLSLANYLLCCTERSRSGYAHIF